MTSLNDEMERQRDEANYNNAYYENKWAREALEELLEKVCDEVKEPSEELKKIIQAAREVLHME